MSNHQPLPQSKIQNLKSKIPHLLLALSIVLYTVYFSWYTINRHNTLNSYAADLSLIDQPLWNTVRGPGGFMELTWGDHQQPRLAEHFEPILIPVALLFFLWDDVRVLLIAQSVALALGALPVFWIARYQLTMKNEQLTNLQFSKGTISSISIWAALVFAIAYLLFPQLQAANIADFHADPFVVTPLLFAFWYATQNRWRWMWFWAIVAMLTKENLPTLTAMLGLFLIFDYYRSKHTKTHSSITNYQLPITNYQSSFFNGMALIFASAIWFLAATFLVVSPLARQYFGTDGPIYFANRFEGGLAALPELLQDPARWQYILGLLAAVGFLPLLAPDLLILGLPVLAANLLSNFPGQYSGEQHYSAPLVVAFILAAIYGTHRLIDRMSLHEVNGWALKKIVLIAVLLWLLGWSLSYHSLRGWTPLSIRTETYQMSAAAVQLPQLLEQIPADAVVSASAGIHPHLAHRRVAYLFPIVEEATYLLVDVTDIPGVHPNDARTKIMEMLNTDWSLLQADNGLILASKSPQPLSSPAPQLSSSFFNFTHPSTPPSFPTSLIFGDGRLRLLGYDVHDDPDDGVTFSFYWQAVEPLPESLKLWPLIYNDLGQLLSDPTQVPMIATVWYPPEQWQPGEIVVTETLPQLLPDSFHLGIATGLGTNSFNDTTQRFPISSELDGKSRSYPGHWIQLASFNRQSPFLIHRSPVQSLQPLIPAETQFGPSIQLTGFWLDSRKPIKGTTLPVLLEWRATQPPETDFTVFIHMLAPDGSLVAQSDAFPTWLTPQPTSQWPLGEPILDSHVLNLPANLPPATYSLELGLYDSQTLERLTLPDGSNTFQLTQIEIK